MSVLKNPRHERFAQLLTHGMTADEAHTKAGYRQNRRNVTRLTTKEDIRDRVAELQAVAAERTVITLASHLKDLKELRDKACAEGRYSAAIRAEIARGRAAGLYVERIEAVERNFVVRLPAKVEDTEEWVRLYGPKPSPTKH